MGIKVTAKTKNKESLKLLNQIQSFLFEQEFGELNGNPSAKSALKNAVQELSKLIR